MGKIYTLLLLLLLSPSLFAQKYVQTVYTDYQGYYQSIISPINPIGSHNVIGFTWEGQTFSTGVNDSIMISNHPNTIAQEFKAFPTDSLANPLYVADSKKAVNNIGLGVSPTDLPNYMGYKKSNFKHYIGDGINGLDIGTGVFNIRLKEKKMKFNNIAISASSIGDGIPDVLITQIGNAPSGVDVDFYTFSNLSNADVGGPYKVSFANNLLTTLFNNDYYFYKLGFNSTVENNDNLNINAELTHNNNVSGGTSRPVRMLALDWSELGINTSNYHLVYSFNQTYSGQSDTAFIAYNISSLKFRRKVSGTIKAINKSTMQENVFPNAKLSIYTVDEKTNVETFKAITTSNSNGVYEFKNLESNGANEVYRVVLDQFTDYNPTYFIVNNKNGRTLNYLDMELQESDSKDNDFVLGRFCVVAPAASSTGISSTNSVIGITTSSNPNASWPMHVPNSFLTLDSQSSGFVITRVDPNKIPTQDLVEGMLIFDIVENCLKLYNGTSWHCIERDCNLDVYDPNRPIFP